MTGPKILVFVALTLTALPQNRQMSSGGEKSWLVVSMIGAGSYADPRRPAFVREARVPFRMQLSDDGTMALVEVSGLIPVELKRLHDQVRTDARARIFHASKDKLADVLTEFRKHKKDFDPASFALPAAVKPSLVTPR